MITLLVLGQHHQVITALVGLPVPIEHTTTGHIHFTPEDRLEKLLLCGFQLLPASRKFFFRILALYFSFLQPGYLLLQILDFTVRLAVLLIHIVEKLLDTEHIAMIGHGNPLHSIGHRLIHQSGNRSLAIQNGILRMNM